MLTTENSRSPLRILEQSSKGAVRPGDLGVVMARAGVGTVEWTVYGQRLLEGRCYPEGVRDDGCLAFMAQRFGGRFAL